MRPTAFVAALLLGALLAPHGSAEASEGALYFTAESGPAAANGGQCTANHGYTMATTAPADGKAYTSGSTEALACNTYFTYTAESAFQLGGAVTVQFYLSCDTPALQSTPVTLGFRARILHNGEDIGGTVDGDLPPGEACTGSALDYSATVDAGTEAFAVGDTLAAQLILWNTDTTGTNFHVLVGAGTPSGLRAVGLPDANAPKPEAGSKTVYTNATGTAVAISHTFNNASSDTYVYNWTSTATSLDVSYNVTVGNGTVAYMVKDSSGKTLSSGTLSKTGASTKPQTVPAKAGLFQVTLKYTKFKGVMKLNLAPTAAAGNSTASTTGAKGGVATQSSDGASSSTANLDLVDGAQRDEPAPDVSPLLAISMLGALAAVRRRRDA